jgi:hypothetical protein
MPKQKESAFIVRLPVPLNDKFKVWCAVNKKSKTGIIRNFIEKIVKDKAK